MFSSMRPHLVPLPLRGGFVALGALAILGVVACVTADGQTPTCNYNVDKNGVHLDDAGCERFAVCAANPSDPTVCCVDSSGGPLSGNLLTECLFGYGVSSGTGTATGTGTGTATDTGTGTGTTNDGGTTDGGP